MIVSVPTLLRSQPNLLEQSDLHLVANKFISVITTPSSSFVLCSRLGISHLFLAELMLGLFQESALQSLSRRHFVEIRPLLADHNDCLLHDLGQAHRNVAHIFSSLTIKKFTIRNMYSAEISSCDDLTSAHSVTSTTLSAAFAPLQPLQGQFQNFVRPVASRFDSSEHWQTGLVCGQCCRSLFETTAVLRAGHSFSAHAWETVPRPWWFQAGHLATPSRSMKFNVSLRERFDCQCVPSLDQ